jgi:preprotein translocase SecE subunit
VADDKPSAKEPRRIRKIETVREKVEKSNAAANEVKTAGPIRKTVRVITKPFRILGRGFKWLNRFKPLRIIGYVLVPVYFRNSWKELRLVTWPSKKDSRRLTLAVMSFAVIFGILIAVVDYGLDKIFKRILLK